MKVIEKKQRSPEKRPRNMGFLFSGNRPITFLAGFTLVEVLIVVVIIAILAALVLPRMTGQIERAKLAEPIQMIGAMKRGAERAADLNGGEYPTTLIYNDPFALDWAGDWSDIGFRDIELSTQWAYFYDGWGTGYTIGAYDNTPAPDNTSADYLWDSVTTPLGSWACEGRLSNGNEYAANAAAVDPTKPCKPE